MEKGQIFLNEKEYCKYRDCISNLKTKLENTRIMNNLDGINQL